MTNADVLTLSLGLNTNPSLVTASVSGPQVTLSYAANQSGSASLTLRATDAAGFFAEQTFAVTTASDVQERGQRGTLGFFAFVRESE